MKTTIAPLAQSLTRLEDAVAKLKEIQETHSRLDEIAERYVDQAQRLRQAQRNFEFAMSSMRK